MRAKPEKELLKLVDEKRSELFGLRIKVVTGQLTKNATIRALRKEIAQLLTVLKEPKQAKPTEAQDLPKKKSKKKAA